MTFKLQNIERLTAEWKQLATTGTNSIALDSTIDPIVESQESPTEALLRTMSKLNQKTQEVIDSIPILLPVGLQQQKESNNWYSALKSLSVESLSSLRLLEAVSISEENEQSANQVLANCLATATTTLAMAKVFRSLISSTYEPEVVQMLAQAFGNHGLSPWHEIERVPKNSVKKILAELYGDDIVTRVFKLYKLNNSPHITSNDLRALLIGILANLDEAALKHIVANKERHKQITAFAFFDQFLKHPNSNVDKRFAELQPDQLIGFLDCLRKSLIDIDLNALLSQETNYHEQVLRDVNLIYYCNQRTIHPDFPVALSDVLETFKGAGQIKEAFIPVSDQSFLPLSDLLRAPTDQEPVPSFRAHPASFFPKETLSCFFNSQLLPRIEQLAAELSADGELDMGIASARSRHRLFDYPDLHPHHQAITGSSRSFLHASVEPFEFFDQRHPLADIADMIEKMRAGSLSLIDAQKAAVKLDPELKALFGKHECALFENPEPFFHLYELVTKMQDGTILEDKSVLQEVFMRISDPLRNSLAHKIYQLSKDPTKGNTKHWGEIHAFDDLSCLLDAVSTTRDNIFESSYKKITKHASGLLSSLSLDMQVGVYYEIFRMVKPQTDDLNWGKNHAFDKVSRLITALSLRDAINEPNPLLHRLRSRETNVYPFPSIAHLALSANTEPMASSFPNSSSVVIDEQPQEDQAIVFSSPMPSSTSAQLFHLPLPTSQSRTSAGMPRPNPQFFPSTPISRTSSGRLHSPLPISPSHVSAGMPRPNPLLFPSTPISKTSSRHLHSSPQKSERIDSIQELKPTQLFPEMHPLAELAELIENMRSGSMLDSDAQITFVHLDESSRTLFAKHECALIDNPLPFFYLIDLLEKMTNDSISENKSSVLEAFNRVPDLLRYSLAAKIFQLSKDPTKGNVENWGEIHAVDDLLCLKQALASLKSRLLDGIYSKITDYASSILFNLPPEKQQQVYFEIFRIGNPTSNDHDWGKKNALEISSRLITALTLSNAIHMPENISHRRTDRELHSGVPSSPYLSFLTPSKASYVHTPSKSHGKDVAESLSKFFSVASPFSPKKEPGVVLSPTLSARRVLFPINPSVSSASSSSQLGIPSAPNIPIPPAPILEMPPKLRPEELHQKSESNRLKRECEARLRFNEMYTTAPLSPSQLETIHRLEGNISSCRSTISLLLKQGHDTNFSENIIEALNESIKGNEKEIDDIKRSAEIKFKDFEQFKNAIKDYATSEIKLILHEISSQLGEQTEFLAEIGELETFYESFDNEELKKICKSCSHLYDQLLVNGAGRFLFLLISTIKQRIANPELEPVHEPRPFKDQGRSRVLTSNLSSPKPMGSPSLDMSEITNFRFKRLQSLASSSTGIKQDRTSTFSAMFTPVRLRSAPRHQLGREIEFNSPERDSIEAKREKRILKQESRIEEAQQAKYIKLEEDFAREKMVALAKEASKPNLQINEEREALESQLLIAPSEEQENLQVLLKDVRLKIQLKTEEEGNAKSFLREASDWNPSIPHPFATEERLLLATSYAKRQVDDIKSRQIQ